MTRQRTVPLSFTLRSFERAELGRTSKRVRRRLLLALIFPRSRIAFAYEIDVGNKEGVLAVYRYVMTATTILTLCKQDF